MRRSDQKRHAAAPREVSPAHDGVLFLDELSEFQRHVLDVPRQQLEEARWCSLCVSAGFPDRDFGTTRIFRTSTVSALLRHVAGHQLNF